MLPNSKGSSFYNARDFKKFRAKSTRIKSKILQLFH